MSSDAAPIGSAQVPEGVPGQLEDKSARQDAEDIHQHTDLAERKPQDDVEREQKQEEAGNSHGGPAQPLFHGDPFHRLHETISVPLGDGWRN